MVKLQLMKRPPKALQRYQKRGYRIYVGEFTPAYSEATRFAGVAGKRKRWYVLRAGKGFELYDKRGKYYGFFGKAELFGDKVEFVR